MSRYLSKNSHSKFNYRDNKFFRDFRLSPKLKHPSAYISFSLFKFNILKMHKNKLKGFLLSILLKNTYFRSNCNDVKFVRVLR